MIFRNTIHKNKEMRKAFHDWLKQGDLNFNFFGTANFNRPTSIVAGRQSLMEWARLVNRKILRRRVFDAPKSDRIFFVAIPEHPTSNLHFHLLLRAPVNPLKTQRLATKVWRMVVSSGELWMPPISDTGDLCRISKYITKDCWDGFGIEDFIISD